MASGNNSRATYGICLGLRWKVGKKTVNIGMSKRKEKGVEKLEEERKEQIRGGS